MQNINGRAAVVVPSVLPSSILVVSSHKLNVRVLNLDLT